MPSAGQGRAASRRSVGGQSNIGIDVVRAKSEQNVSRRAAVVVNHPVRIKVTKGSGEKLLRALFGLVYLLAVPFTG